MSKEVDLVIKFAICIIEFLFILGAVSYGGLFDYLVVFGAGVLLLYMFLSGFLRSSR
jgi:hypothetical protein